MKWPDWVDYDVLRLCLDSDGNLLRPPSEILYGWTLEDVIDAHDTLTFVAEQKRRLRAQNS